MSDINKAIIEKYDFSQFKRITQFVQEKDSLLFEIISRYPDINAAYLGSSEIIEKLKSINSSQFKSNCKFIESDFYEKFHIKFQIYIIKKLLTTFKNEDLLSFMNRLYSLTDQYTRFIFVDEFKQMNPESFTSHENHYREIFGQANFVLTNTINIVDDIYIFEVLKQ